MEEVFRCSVNAKPSMSLVPNYSVTRVLLGRVFSDNIKQAKHYSYRSPLALHSFSVLDLKTILHMSTDISMEPHCISAY